MRFSSFTYLVGQGLHNLRANRLMTFASMGVLTVCMLLIGAAYLLGVNIDYMVEYIGNQNETVVYMDDATEDQIAAADAAIRSTPHVVGVTYMSPEDVLATYGDMLKDYTNLQQVFQDDNPFKMCIRDSYTSIFYFCPLKWEGHTEQLHKGGTCYVRNRRLYRCSTGCTYSAGRSVQA